MTSLFFGSDRKRTEEAINQTHFLLRNRWMAAMEIVEALPKHEGPNFDQKQQSSLY